MANTAPGHSIAIARTWDGAPVKPDEAVTIELSRDARAWRIDVDAPFHDDPAPGAAPGPVMGLWEYEVVELFVLGSGEHYLEIELGPHGHHLVLELRGRRKVVRSALAIEFETARRGDRWRGRASVAAEAVPADATHFNAYAIHGTGEQRRYLAHAPVPGNAPDFHQLDCFVPLPAAPAAQPG